MTSRARGPRAMNDGKRFGQQVEPLDRMEPSEKRHHFIAGVDLRARAKPLDRSGGHGDGRHAVRDGHNRWAVFGELVFLEGRGRVQQRRGAQVRALDAPVRQRLHLAVPLHRRRLQHASRRDDVRTPGGARVRDRRRAGHVPEAVHVDEIGAGRARPRAAPRPDARQYRFGHASGK